MKRSIISLLLIVGLGCGVTANQPESRAETRDEGAPRERVAFLAGALLGDNVTWSIAQKPVSLEKRSLFERCARALGLPHASDLLSEVSGGRDVPAHAATDKAMQAVMQFESTVRSAHGLEVAQCVRLGGTIMMTIGTASTLELAVSSKDRNLESVASVFRLSVLGLKRMSSTMQLPGETASLLKSLPDYEGHLSEVTRIKNALIKICEKYGLGPLTEIRLRAGLISLADADLSSVWTVVSRSNLDRMPHSPGLSENRQVFNKGDRVRTSRWCGTIKPAETGHPIELEANGGHTGIVLEGGLNKAIRIRGDRQKWDEYGSASIVEVESFDSSIHTDCLDGAEARSSNTPVTRIRKADRVQTIRWAGTAKVGGQRRSAVEIELDSGRSGIVLDDTSYPILSILWRPYVWRLKDTPRRSVPAPNEMIPLGSFEADVRAETLELDRQH